jgi:hypothetical protein
MCLFRTQGVLPLRNSLLTASGLQSCQNNMLPTSLCDSSTGMTLQPTSKALSAVKHHH